MAYVPAKKAKQQEEQIRNGASADPVGELVLQITKFESEIVKALPQHIDAKRMSRMIITEVRKIPDLAICDRASFFAAMIQCARLGLEPGAGLGYIYLIPRWNNKIGMKEVQIIIGYQGMIDLVERSGRVTIDAQVVYAKDQFRYKLGLKPELEHVPYWGIDDPGDVVGCYAVATYQDGRTKFRVLTRYQIEKAKAASDNGGEGKHSPWQSEYGEMARKTAIRRLFKVLPKNPDDPHLTRVLQLEDAFDKGESQGQILDCPQPILDHLKGVTTAPPSATPPVASVIDGQEPKNGD